MDDMKRLTAARMRSLMIVKKLRNHAEFGRAAGGANASAVGNWMTAVNLIPVPKAVALCERYGLTTDWIYRGIPTGVDPGLLMLLNQFMDAEYKAAETPQEAPKKATTKPKSTKRR